MVVCLVLVCAIQRNGTISVKEYKRHAVRNFRYFHVLYNMRKWPVYHDVGSKVPYQSPGLHTVMWASGPIYTIIGYCRVY